MHQPSGLVSSATLSREIEIFLGEAKDVTTFRKRLLPTTHLMGLAGLRSRLRWYKDHINDSMEHPRNGWMPPLQ